MLPPNTLHPPNNPPMGKHRHQDFAGICCYLIRHHGDSLLRILVSTLSPLLGRAYTQCPVQRRHKPPHYERSIQLDVRCHNAGRGTPDVLTAELALAKEVPTDPSIFPWDFCDPCGDTEQGVLFYSAFRDLVDFLVR